MGRVMLTIHTDEGLQTFLVKVGEELKIAPPADEYKRITSIVIDRIEED